jgi:hypothetical protein
MDSDPENGTESDSDQSMETENQTERNKSHKSLFSKRVQLTTRQSKTMQIIFDQFLQNYQANKSAYASIQIPPNSTCSTIFDKPFFQDEDAPIETDLETWDNVTCTVVDLIQPSKLNETDHWHATEVMSILKNIHLLNHANDSFIPKSDQISSLIKTQGPLQDIILKQQLHSLIVKEIYMRTLSNLTNSSP